MVKRACLIVAGLVAACDGATSTPTIADEPPAPRPAPVVVEPAGPIASRHDERSAMVREQLAARDITDAQVLAAMRRVPRHAFVSEALADLAYADHPLPIGHDVTISQPYIVALMTQLAQVHGGDRVLDVGTGSGYQAAVFAEMGAQVWSIEIIEPLAAQARERLRDLGYRNVEVRAGDGYEGWPEHAPFDAIVVAAAAPKIPEPLLSQLAVGGRLVLPVGSSGFAQQLTVVTRTDDGFDTRAVTPVAFVPMTGAVRQ